MFPGPLVPERFMSSGANSVATSNMAQDRSPADAANQFPVHDDCESIEGKVKWFDVKKGFGFITGPEGQDVFVHFSTIDTDGFRTLKDNELVEYKLCKGDKGFYAADVQRKPQVKSESYSDAPDKRQRVENVKAVARASTSSIVDDGISSVAADRPRRRPVIDGYVG